jgi:cyclopropane fatty-acyl-phospholipid synthase-like methyltransferase
MESTHPGMPREDYLAVMKQSFDTAYRTSGDLWTGEPAMRHLVALLTDRLAPDSHVLDVGAGRLRDTGILLDAGLRVTAVDLVRQQEWDRAGERWGDRVRFRVCDARDLSADAEYDAVLDNGSLHHQLPEDYPAYLGALRRSLKPGGLFAVSLFAQPEQETEGTLIVLEDGRLSRIFTPDESRALLAENGFAVTTTRRVERDLHGWAYLLVLARSTRD